MRYHSRLTKLLIFMIPLFSWGVLLESATAVGKSVKGGIISSQTGRNNSQACPSHSTTKGIAPQPRAPRVLHKALKIPREKPTFKKRNFNFLQPPLLFPDNFSPNTPEYSDATTSHLPEDSQTHNALIEENPSPSESSHPLVIELRCGKYVRIPWPESSLLSNYEEGQEEQCSDSK